MLGKRTAVIILMMLMFVRAWGGAWAAPDRFTLQGVLGNEAGRAVQATVDMTFEIFTAETDGTSLWSETHLNVPVNNGVYSVVLGSVEVGTLTPGLFSADSRWLEISVDGEKLAPRQQLTSSAYAMNADLAGSVNVADGTTLTVGGNPADLTIDGTNLNLHFGSAPEDEFTFHGNIVASDNNINGMVKGWARINADGTVASCYKCSTSSSDTKKLELGTYEVDFTPLATDISSRPRVATVDYHNAATDYYGFAVLADRSGDASAVQVKTVLHTGAAFDLPFTIVIY